MKNLRLLTITLLITGGFMQTVEAQFWKKIGERAKRGVEKTVERKVEQKTAKETDKAFEKVMDIPGGMLSGDAPEPKRFYHFNYKYNLEFTFDDKKSNATYYLNRTKEYIGSKIEGADQYITIIDPDPGVSGIFILIEKNGKKKRMAMGFNPNKVAEGVTEDIDFTVTSLNETKKILKYTCEGYLVKGKTVDGKIMETTVWLLKNPPVRFNMNTGFSQLGQISNNNKSAFQELDGLALEMDIYSYKLKRNGKKKDEERMNMICTELAVNTVTIDMLKFPR